MERVCLSNVRTILLLLTSIKDTIKINNSKIWEEAITIINSKHNNRTKWVVLIISGYSKTRMLLARITINSNSNLVGSTTINTEEVNNNITQTNFRPNSTIITTMDLTTLIIIKTNNTTTIKHSRRKKRLSICSTDLNRYTVHDI